MAKSNTREFTRREHAAVLTSDTACLRYGSCPVRVVYKRRMGGLCQAPTWFADMGAGEEAQAYPDVPQLVSC
jgi:hypothetical protein